MRQQSAMVLLGAAAVAWLLCGCEAVNPERATPQPDTNLFGNLLEVEAIAGQPSAQLVRVRVGIPRALVQAKEGEGQPTPTLEKGLISEVRVDADTVVLLDGRPEALARFNPGTEVVVLPLAGTTRMIGDSLIQTQAAYFLDFETYRRWRLPSLGTGEAVAEQPDATVVNTAGIEHSPVPLDGGRVLYFAARQRLPAKPGQPAIGPQRPGLPPAAADSLPVERTFRCELGPDGWSAPEVVSFPELDDATAVRVSWVNEDETVCLVTVETPGTLPWVGRSSRASTKAAWGTVERLADLGQGDAADAAYLAGSKSQLAFVSRRLGVVQRDVFSYDPAADPKVRQKVERLDSRVNSSSDEWAIRVGPKNELLFCRLDRQLVLAGGAVREVRLPGPHRSVLTEAALTGDGRWLFFCMPRFTLVELDQDIYVSPWQQDGTPGMPVPVDSWRPPA